MSEETSIVEKTDQTQEIIDLENFQTNGQIDTRAFWYRVSNKITTFNLTVLSQSSTFARDGIKQQYPDHTVSFLGTSDKIMQVNG